MKSKLIILQGKIFVLLTILFVASCQKKDHIKKENSGISNIQKPKEVRLDANTRFLLNGKDPVTFSEFQGRFASSGGEANRILSSEENILLDFGGENYIFENDTLLYNWAVAQETTEAGYLIAMLDKSDSLQNYAIARGIIDDSLATVSYSDSLNGGMDLILQKWLMHRHH